MSQQVSKSHFKPRALEYFRQVQTTGEALVITEHGRPVLRIEPFMEDVEAAMRPLRGSVLRYEDPTESVALDDWEALR